MDRQTTKQGKQIHTDTGTERHIHRQTDTQTLRKAKTDIHTYTQTNRQAITSCRATVAEHVRDQPATNSPYGTHRRRAACVCCLTLRYGHGARRYPPPPSLRHEGGGLRVLRGQEPRGEDGRKGRLERKLKG